MASGQTAAAQDPRVCTRAAFSSISLSCTLGDGQAVGSPQGDPEPASALHPLPDPPMSEKRPGSPFPSTHPSTLLPDSHLGLLCTWQVQASLDLPKDLLLEADRKCIPLRA